MYNYYNPSLKQYARELRNNSISRAEKFIWKTLLSRNRMGVKFKRQRPIDNFIVDFFCQERGLIIEIDGNSHLNKGEYGRYRQSKLESIGYQMIRFSEGTVLNQLENVDFAIRHALYCLENEE